MRLLCALGFHLGLVEMARLVIVRSQGHVWMKPAGERPWPSRRVRHAWQEERFLRCWCGRTPEAAV